MNKGIKVKIFDLQKGLEIYDNVKFIRLTSEDYNLLIMEDYLSIVGEINGRVDIKGDHIDLSFDNISAYYMNSKNVFNLMIKEV